MILVALPKIRIPRSGSPAPKLCDGVKHCDAKEWFARTLSHWKNMVRELNRGFEEIPVN